MDIRQLVKGTKLYLPIFVEGALFSIGDTHAAQGDGEVCGTAIEASMETTIKFTLHKGKTIKRSEEHTSELQSRGHLVCRLLLEKKKNEYSITITRKRRNYLH